MKRIVLGLTGHIGAGKSTAARFLCEDHGFVELTFKSAMLRPLCVMFGVPSTVFTDRETKEKPCAALMGRSPRHIMQTFGTDWGRGCVGPGIWSEMLQREVAQYPEDHIVISDVRFDNEAALVQSLDGLVVQIRDEFGVGASTHSSEAGIDPSFIDRRVLAHRGNIGMLQLRLWELFKDLEGRL